LANSVLDVYDKFHNYEDAKDLVALLKSNDVLHKVEMLKPLADPLFIGGNNALSPNVVVKLRPQDFELVNQVIKKDVFRRGWMFLRLFLRSRPRNKPGIGNEGMVITMLFIGVGCFWPSLAGGVLATIICFGVGYYYWQHKTIGPKGEKFYSFDLKTRETGKMILISTVFISLAYMVWFYGHKY